MKKITIRDVAKEAGVSISAVSRVLNGIAGVKLENRIKVLATIEKLNYIPDPAAKALVSGKNKAIGVVVPNIRNSCLSNMVQGIIEELQFHNIDLLLLDFNEDSRIEKKCFEALNEKMIDGAIIVSGSMPDDDIRKLAQKMPVVQIERNPKGLPVDSIVVDDFLGMKLLIDHLLKYGHEKIGLIAGKKEQYSSISRSNAFVEVMETYGKKKDFTIVNSPWSVFGGYEAFTELLKNNPEITAVVCISDQMALGAMGAAYKMGISIPQDISIVGYDSFDEGSVAVPPLTTLYYPAFQIGELAAQFILEGQNKVKKGYEVRVLPLSLISRESVAAPRLKVKNRSIIQ